MHPTLKLAIFAATASLLVACGGGGDDPTPTPAPTPVPTPSDTAEGAYSGTLADGRHFSTLVLEDGAFYSYYGPLSNGATLVQGAVIGNGASKDGAYTSTQARDYPILGGFVDATVSATYDAGAKLVGTITEGGRILGFASDVVPASSYDYNASANAAAVEGTWAMTSMTGAPIAVTVTSGALTATSAGCNFSGSVVPRPSGKNVFDVALTFGPAPCALPGQQAEGIAITGKTPDGRTQLMVAGTSTDRDAAVMAFGVR